MTLTTRLLTPETWDDFAALVEAKSGCGAAAVECPACESRGAVFGTPSPNWEADWDVSDGIAYAAGAYVDSITLDGAVFDCRVCGLSLFGPLLDTAGIGNTFRHNVDFDLEAASDFFTRQLMEEDY